MKDLLLEITELTTKMETNYPELYRSLDENLITLATSSHTHVDEEVMKEYLKSLKQLLQHHIETHKN